LEEIDKGAEDSLGSWSGSPPDEVTGDSGEMRIPFGNDKQRKLYLRGNSSR
jgi:hypothetical protein